MKDIEDFKDEWRNEIKSDVTFVDFRIQKESKEHLEFISNATGLSKSIVLHGILDDYLKIHRNRLNKLMQKRSQLDPKENDLLFGKDK